MFWFGSLMSQVLQWTQFCALITKRGSAALLRPTRRRRPGNSAPTGRHRRHARTLSAAPCPATLEVHRLVLLVVGVGEEHRGELVEGEHAVGLRIGDRRELARPACSVAESGLPWPSVPNSEKPKRVGPHVEAAERDAEHGAEARPQRLDVAHLPQVAADRRARARPPRSRRARRWRGRPRAPRRRARPPACRTGSRCGCP